MNRHEGTILILLVAGIPGSILIGYIFHENVSGQIPDNTSAGREVSLSQQGFIQPSLLVPLSHSSFLVSDLNNKALLLVQENGTIQRIITREVAQPYGYWDIAGIAQDSQGNIYLSDRSTHRILKLSGTGSLSTSWGGFGEGEGQFDSPSGIGIVNGSGKELVYVCDTGNARIEVFTQQGIYQYSFQIPSDEQKNIRIVRPKEQKTSVDIQKFKVIPQKGANPAFVKRTFTIQSSGSALDMIFSVNRSVYLGAQKISFQSSDISTRNPEEWVPVVSAILADPTTQDTIQSTLAEIRRNANIKKICESAKLECIAHFIQQIPLTEQTENRYPVEILHDKMGNTYDKALFLYGLLKEAGYDVVYLAYPGLSHAAVGIRLTDPVNSKALATYTDSNGSIYLYINPDGPGFIGGIAQKYRKIDPFVIHLDTENGTGICADHMYSTYVVESIFSLSDKYQFLLNKEKEEKGDDARKIRDRYQKIKGVLDFIEKNPWNTELAYMRIKNAKVNEIRV